MMPYQTYQLYATERPKTAAEIRQADERAGRTAAALAGMLRQLAPAVQRRRSRQRDRAMDDPLPVPCAYGRMTGTMEVR
jgi:hypothetical protein